MIRALVLADTHLDARRLDRLPPAVRRAAAGSDVILHAGDVVTAAVLDELATHAPVHAVCGNNDHELVGTLPERLELVLDGVRVAMVHDSGARAGRGRRMERWFPDADVVVFGHSHQPVVERSERGLLLVNPGSPTQRRRQPYATFALLELHHGAVDAQLVELGADGSVLGGGGPAPGAAGPAGPAPGAAGSAGGGPGAAGAGGGGPGAAGSAGPAPGAAGAAGRASG